jgi:hypothetical protein
MKYFFDQVYVCKNHPSAIISLELQLIECITEAKERMSGMN